ncbi:LysR family transcriptional regulator [Stenotrophomonas maltophilia]
MKALRYFLAVAESLSFNRAAERLHVSQPVVTRTIAQLEHSIGARLFSRTTRRVALTPAGAMLLKEARSLMAHVECVQRVVPHAVAEESRRLTVGATSIAMQTVTPTFLRRFTELHPEVTLEVRELPSQTQFESLLSADIDVGFVLLPGAHPDLIVRPVHQERMRLAIPEHHPHARNATRGAQIPLSAFANDEFIIPSRAQNSTMYDEILKTCETAGFRPRLRECEENQTCLGLAKTGLGVVFIPSQSQQPIVDGLSLVDIEDPVPVLELAIAWRKEDPSPYLAIFKELDAGSVTVA